MCCAHSYFVRRPEAAVLRLSVQRERHVRWLRHQVQETILQLLQPGRYHRAGLPDCGMPACVGIKWMLLVVHYL